MLGNRVRIADSDTVRSQQLALSLGFRVTSRAIVLGHIWH